MLFRAIFDRDATFDEDDTFIGIMPVRRKYVAGRIAGEQFEGTGL